MNKEENYLLDIDLAKDVEYAQYLDRKEHTLKGRRTVYDCGEVEVDLFLPNEEHNTLHKYKIFQKKLNKIFKNGF